MLPKNSARSDVSKLGIDVKKVKAVHRDPVQSVTEYLSTHATDLIVLATDQSKGASPWFSKSIAGPIAHASRQMTLFIPKGVDGFVSIQDGSISLTSILMRGSHSERVLRRSPCPLLGIPAGGFIASVLETESAKEAVS